MLKQKRLHHYFDEHWMLMLFGLASFSESQEPEALHKMRVQAKKIRAITKLVEKHGETDLSSDLKPLLQMYQAAGNIRQLHVKLEHHPTDISSKKKLVELEKKFAGQADKYAKDLEVTYDKLTARFTAIPKKYVLKWYDNLYAKLQHDFKTENLWHKGRKKIKRLLYVYNALPKSMRKKTGIDIKFMTALEKKAGFWNDLGEILKDPKVDPKVLQKVKTRHRSAVTTIKKHVRQFPALKSR